MLGVARCAIARLYALRELRQPSLQDPVGPSGDGMGHGGCVGAIGEGMTCSLPGIMDPIGEFTAASWPLSSYRRG